MICPECKAEGKESRVYVGMAITTCVASAPFYDEKGRYHSHDPNTTSQSYRCSNGHSWTEEYTSTCPTCGDWRDPARLQPIQEDMR